MLARATASKPNGTPPRGSHAAGKALGMLPGLRPGLGHERCPGVTAATSSSSRLPAGERALFDADTGSGKECATGSGRGYNESCCVLGVGDAVTAATVLSVTSGNTCIEFGFRFNHPSSCRQGSCCDAGLQLGKG